MASPAAAHDFFLLPSDFVSRPGQAVTVSATVSAAFPKIETAVAADRVSTSSAVGPTSPEPLLHVGEGRLQFQAKSAGAVVAAVTLARRDVEYPNDRISLILQEYDIDGPAVAAVDALAQPRTLRVSSRRFAKSIVCVADCRDSSAAARPTGQDLEFVSSDAATGSFVLLSLGRPLANHPVSLAQMGRRDRLRTDAQGVIIVPSSHKGPLMLFAAQMTPPAAEHARFTLNLASLTFSR
ncbi:DUF4198 domain-containing protein [Phenylobacterium sp.]|uniref:DUF4198 domain-containing protein n=1 Tax=Phenylobacterium sp. TaxID=1871053 RepID=UPI003983B169